MNTGERQPLPFDSEGQEGGPADSVLTRAILDYAGPTPGPRLEAYCRAKWEYGRTYVYHLISAAQLFTHLLANCKHRKPDHESQLRPLIGLSPEQAQQAWEHAAEKAVSRNITARLVKTAVQELGFAYHRVSWW